MSKKRIYKIKCICGGSGELKIYDSDNKELANIIKKQTLKGETNQMRCAKCKRKIVMIKPYEYIHCRDLPGNGRAMMRSTQNYEKNYPTDKWIKYEKDGFLVFIEKEAR